MSCFNAAWARSDTTGWGLTVTQTHKLTSSCLPWSNTMLHPQMHDYIAFRCNQMYLEADDQWERDAFVMWLTNHMCCPEMHLDMPYQQKMNLGTAKWLHKTVCVVPKCMLDLDIQMHLGVGMSRCIWLYLSYVLCLNSGCIWGLILINAVRI